MFYDQVLEPIPIEIEITALKKEVAGLRLLGQSNLSREIAELRSLVQEAHADAEEVLSGILCKGLYAKSHNYKKYSGKKNFKEFRESYEKMVGQTGSLMKQATDALNMGILSQEQWQQVRMLNNIRITLSHPRDLKWKLFEDREAYASALRTVIETTRMLARVDVAFGLRGM